MAKKIFDRKHLRLLALKFRNCTKNLFVSSSTRSLCTFEKIPMLEALLSENPKPPRSRNISESGSFVGQSGHSNFCRQRSFSEHFGQCREENRKSRSMGNLLSESDFPPWSDTNRKIYRSTPDILRYAFFIMKFSNNTNFLVKKFHC